MNFVWTSTSIERVAAVGVFLVGSWKRVPHASSKVTSLSSWFLMLDFGETDIQAKKEVWKSTTCSEVKFLHMLEMDAWLDLGSIYTKLEAWHDSNIYLDKARSIDFFYPKYWHVRDSHQDALHPASPTPRPY